jgi:hypothetical protein
LSWPNNLGIISEPAAPINTPVSEPSRNLFSKEELSWLNFGDFGQPQPFDVAQTFSVQEEPGWPKIWGGEPEPLSTPPFAETGTSADRRLVKESG